jgi:PRTRC genetic system ThiF family protein
MDKRKTNYRKILGVKSTYFDTGFRFTVKVVGIGGTGSHVLEHLVRIHFAMIELGMPGLLVVAIDDDHVEPHNLARQRFVLSDIKMNKAEAVILKINNAYGLDWIALPERQEPNFYTATNFLITATDSGFLRNELSEYIKHQKEVGGYGTHLSSQKLLAWIDAGNETHSGQVVITDGLLPTPVDLNGKPFEVDRLPGSCSVQESLRTQDLFVNAHAALHVAQALWQLIQTKHIEYYAVWFNVKKCALRHSSIESLKIMA